MLAAGTALLTEGVVEYEVDGDRLGITLLRSVGSIAKPTLATRPVWAGPPVPAPGGQCHGTSELELAVLPGATADELVDQWERFALPLLDVVTPGRGSVSAGRLLEVDGPHLSAIRRVDGELEIRVWSDRAEPSRATVADSALEVGAYEVVTHRVSGR